MAGRGGQGGDGQYMPMWWPQRTLNRLLYSAQGVVRAIRLESGRGVPWPPAMRNPFRYFNSSPEVIRLAVMMYIRYPLSLRQAEDLLFERGIDICHETLRIW